MPPPLDPQELVRIWHGPVYQHAHRLLGCPAAAADATQEALTRALRNIGRFDPERPFRPWVLRITTRVALNMIRARRTRRVKERIAAEQRDSAWTFASPGLARDEDLVARCLRALPSEARMLVVLHYFNHLGASELSNLLDLPRSTVRSRLSRAIDDMREHSARVGSALSGPAIARAIRDAAPAAVPPSLAPQLLSTTGVGHAAVATGGILIMPTKLSIALGACLLIGAATWFGVHAWLPADDHAQPRVGGESAGHAQAGERAPDLAGQQRAGSARPSHQKHADLLGTSTATLTPPGNTDAADGTATAGSPAPAQNGSPARDWAPFSSHVAAVVEALGSLSRMERLTDPVGHLDDADRSRLVLVSAEFMKLRESARASTRAPTPAFDKEIFVEFASGILESSGVLAEDARAGLADRARAEFDAALGELDLRRTPPVQARKHRKRAVDRLLRWARDHGRDGSESSQDGLDVLTRTLLDGGPLRTLAVSVGDDSDGGSTPGNSQQAIVDEWANLYALSADQLPLAQAQARGLVVEIRQMLRARGMARGSPSHPDMNEIGKLYEDMHQVQVQHELALIHHLKPTQVWAAHGRPALEIDFSWSADQSLVETGSGM